MSQHVRVHPFAEKRGAALGCRSGVDADATFDRVAGEAPAGAGGEQRVLGLPVTFLKPDGENRLGVFGEWDGSLLATFALDADVRSGAKRDVGRVDVDEL